MDDLEITTYRGNRSGESIDDAVGVGSGLGFGIMVKTDIGRGVRRSLRGEINRIDIINEDGLSGNPKVDIAVLNHLDFMEISPSISEERRLKWSFNAKTLEFRTINNSNVLLGQEEFIIAKAIVNITKGQVVYISGFSANTPEISIANSNRNDQSKSDSVGVAATNIPPNTLGKVVLSGIVSNLDTESLNIGDQLYLSDDGNGTLTSVRPSAPSFVVYIGSVIENHAANGKIAVNPYKIPYLRTLSDVDKMEKADYKSGQIIMWDDNAEYFRYRTIDPGTGITIDNNNGINGNPTIKLTDIKSGNAIIGALAYNGTNKIDGKFYGGETENPSSTTRLNYDGNFHATNLYSYGDLILVKENGSATVKYAGEDTRTYTIPDVNTSYFVMTQGNQVISGVKTFTDDIFLKGIVEVGADANAANIQATAGSGTDRVGGNLILLSGNSTGTATSSIDFQTPTPALESGDTENLLESRLEITNEDITDKTGTLVGTETTQNIYNTTATTVHFAGDATTGNFGYAGTDTSTTNISTGATAIDKTKTINIGTGGLDDSTTEITIGSSTGTSTTNISTGATNNKTKTINIGTGGATGSTTNITLGDTAGTSTTNISTGATNNKTKTINIGTGGLDDSTTEITLGSSTGTSITNIATGATTNNKTKEINIGTGGTTGSTTTITLGSSLHSSSTNTVTINGTIEVKGTSNAAGRFYAGDTSPSNTTRLNYDGNLYVNNLRYVGSSSRLSDIRLKENVYTIENALSSVLQLRGVHYTLKESQKSNIGLIAQEVEQVIPEVVSDDGQYKYISYSNIIGVLVEAIKEQQKAIEEQQKMINELRNLLLK